MERRGSVVFVLILLVMSLFSSVMISAADDFVGPPASAPGNIMDPNDFLTGSQTGSLDFLNRAIPFYNALKTGDVDFFKDYVRLLVLLLIIVLIYSSLSYGNFPESISVRLILSVIVGILATMLITNEELFTAVRSYTAMGLALLIFFPILILLFFTFIVSSQARPFGILAQKLLWLIYSVYLFVNSATLLIIRATWNGQALTGFSGFLSKFLFGEVDTTKLLTGVSFTMLIVLLAVSIGVFIIFVASNKAVTAWMAHEARDADMMRQKDNLKRSQALREEEAEATRKRGKG